MKILFISIIIIICISCYSLQETTHHNHITEKTLAKNRIASKILRDFSHTYIIPPSSHNTRAKFVYPDYFGGQYINNRNKAVIYITDKRYKKEIKERTGNNKVLIRTCKYSHNLLDSLMVQVWDIIKKDTVTQKGDYTHFSCIEHFKIRTFALDEIHNRVNIYMDNHSRKTIKEFKQKILDSPALHFPKQTGQFIKE